MRTHRSFPRRRVLFDYMFKEMCKRPEGRLHKSTICANKTNYRVFANFWTVRKKALTCWWDFRGDWDCRGCLEKAPNLVLFVVKILISDLAQI